MEFLHNLDWLCTLSHPVLSSECALAGVHHYAQLHLVLYMMSWGWRQWHYSPQMGQSPRFLTWSLKVLHYTSVSDLLGNIDSFIQSGISAVSNFVFLSLWVASWKFCWPGTKAGDSTSAWPCVIQMVPHCDPQDLSVTGCFGNVITNLLERDWYRANTLWSRLDVNVTTSIHIRFWHNKNHIEWGRQLLSENLNFEMTEENHTFAFFYELKAKSKAILNILNYNCYFVTWSSIHWGKENLWSNLIF